MIRDVACWLRQPGQATRPKRLKHGGNKLNRVHLLGQRSGRLQPGQTMAEYALIVMLVALVAIGAWALLGSNITTAVNAIASCV
jgi:Flp pilus assembly pilin Flp